MQHFFFDNTHAKVVFIGVLPLARSKFTKGGLLSISLASMSKA